jgi:hypothetical protein
MIDLFPVPMPDESAMRQRFWILEERRGGDKKIAGGASRAARH